MTLIVMVAIAVFSVVRSVQVILVPFRPLLTGLISNLETRGNSSGLETLETLKEVEFTMREDAC